MTRAERLKALMFNIPVEKLADLLGYSSDFCNKQCPYRHEDSCIGKCKQGRIDWLNQEAMTEKKAREDFMEVVYRELSDDVDNCRANRIIDAADEYMEETVMLLHEEWERGENEKISL